MSSMLRYISLLSLCLIQQLQAQGLGCPSPRCPTPGQIRTNALWGQNGEFLGGCICKCPVNACPPPSIPNFNPVTLEGDCSCRVPVTQPPIPVVPFSNGPGALPAVQVLCDVHGPCSCPPGTTKPCKITCGGIDGCKDGVIDCNNDGHPCTVECIGDIACSATVTINGPRGAALYVNCIGDKACEGSVTINGNQGTDLQVACEGMEACKGNALFNFGSGIGRVSCNGDPQSCQGATFKLLKNVWQIPGAAFSCIGPLCPATAPQPFSNAGPGSNAVICSSPGDCSCPVGTKDDCTINCVGSIDACKDGVIECNNDGFDCFVNCMEHEACSGATSIMGPANAALTVQCIGDKSCEGAVSVNAERATDVTIVCQGSESCKGNTQFNFGTRTGITWCNGNPDACLGAVFNLPQFAASTPGVAFSCEGNFCPADAPKSFNNVPPTPPPTSPTPPPTPPTPPPTPPPIPRVIPAIPAPLPAPAGPVPSIPIPAPLPVPAVISGPWCCQTTIPDFTPWNGQCWDKHTQVSCVGVVNNRCIWDETRCFQSAPVCTMTDQPCIANSECCSEVCRTSVSAAGQCR